MKKEIVLADNAGFCFGVKRAVDITLKNIEGINKRIYTLGQLIHNNDVVHYLMEKNIYPIEYKDIDKLNKGDTIIIRSHGVSKDILNTLIKKDLNVIDATCPFVSNIHQKVEKYYKLGYQIVIVGDSEHPEVIGINGWCNNSAIISSDASNLKSIKNKVCVVSQTTEKQHTWTKVLNVLVESCKEIVAFNTICSATSIRQKFANELSKSVDIMIVLGGHHSSNTTKLYEICKNNCANTLHVENSGEIPDNIYSCTNIKKIGVTAGASTPDWIIKEAIDKMSNEKELSMNEQLQFMDQNDVQISVGDKIKGIILSVSEKEAFLNINYKADAILPKKEVTKDENSNLKDILKEGTEIEVKVLSRMSEDGYVVVSLKEIKRSSSLQGLKEAFENKTTVNVTVKEVIKGGVIALYNDIIKVFIPASHVDLYHVQNLEQYVGKSFDIEIIEYAMKRNISKIVGSRKQVLKEAKSAKEEVVWDSLQKDTIADGEVKRLATFGAFVEVNGVDGLLHISEISWGRIENPAQVLKVGDKVKVYILDVDKEKKKLSLSIKKTIENPWNNVDTKYPIGSVVLGKVIRFANFGAFVELEPGVDGLVHISQISDKRIAKPQDVLTINEEVKAKIIDVDKENKKIGLSIKEINEI